MSKGDPPKRRDSPGGWWQSLAWRGDLWELAKLFPKRKRCTRLGWMVPTPHCVWRGRSGLLLELQDEEDESSVEICWLPSAGIARKGAVSSFHSPPRPICLSTRWKEWD